MRKGELASLRERLAIAEAISEARKAALEKILSVVSSERRDYAEALLEADRAVRAVKAGIAPGTGAMVEVAIGTPYSCDPTTEAYWSS